MFTFCVKCGRWLLKKELKYLVPFCVIHQSRRRKKRAFWYKKHQKFDSESNQPLSAASRLSVLSSPVTRCRAASSSLLVFAVSLAGRSTSPACIDIGEPLSLKATVELSYFPSALLDRRCIGSLFSQKLRGKNTVLTQCQIPKARRWQNFLLTFIDCVLLSVQVSKKGNGKWGDRFTACWNSSLCHLLMWLFGCVFQVVGVGGVRPAVPAGPDLVLRSALPQRVVHRDGIPLHHLQHPARNVYLHLPLPPSEKGTIFVSLVWVD